MEYFTGSLFSPGFSVDVFSLPSCFSCLLVQLSLLFILLFQFYIVKGLTDVNAEYLGSCKQGQLWPKLC